MQPKARVALIGPEAQENLGLRYISSMLIKHGHKTKLISIDLPMHSLADALLSFAPNIVGFSLIFQQYLPDYSDMIKELRGKTSAHFTMGGHFSSFEPKTVLGYVPELDSLVMHEGEKTMLALASRISEGLPWKGLRGLAYMKADRFRLNQSRKPVSNLDCLPLPDRRSAANRKNAEAFMLGSRGCTMKCSFCSIQNFYRNNGTPGRRLRSPDKVVDEFEYLHKEHGTKSIIFNDDDFLGGGKKGIDWAHAVAKGIRSRGLHHKVKWKISCRSNEVTKNNIAPLAESGLAHIYLGVESGSADSLKNLNKALTASSHFKAKEVIQEYALAYDFGFMLLEPWSTLKSVRDNISFLRDFSSDGSATAFFCRMLPYSGTSSAAKLTAEGRLRTVSGSLVDYNFLDSRLDAFYDWTLKTFNHRNYSDEGTGNLLRNLIYSARVSRPDEYLSKNLHALAAQSNSIMIETLSAALTHVKSMKADKPEPENEHLELLALKHKQIDHEIRSRLAGIIKENREYFVDYAN